jgi:Flp pilus assembly CpaF family ATPase
MRQAHPALVARLHADVGAAVSEQQEAADGAGRGLLTLEDERMLSRKLIADRLADMADRALQEGRDPLGRSAEAALSQAVMDSLHGLGRIQPYLDDPAGYTDIHIAGHNSVWLTQADGHKVRGEPVADSDEELVDIIATAARRLGRSERRWDYAHPELDMQLPNGDRLHGLMAVTSRPNVTIRRHSWGINRLGQLPTLGTPRNRRPPARVQVPPPQRVSGPHVGMVDERLGHFLSAAVVSRQNVIVCGGTGTGKTTLLRCLINEIPPEERLITVEDSLELGLERFADLHPDYETLEARSPNIEGVGEFSMADLVRSGLRMDPDRVIVGEVRGKEVLPMLLAMSQGNDGSMCSVHSESSRGVFGRLVMYAAMTEERLEPEVTNMLVAEAVDLVVHLGWTNGQRCVRSVREVTGAEGRHINTNEVFRPGPDGRAVPGYPLTEETLGRLEEVGFDRRVLEGGGR